MNATAVSLITAVLLNLPTLIAEVQKGVKDEQGAADATAKIKAVLTDSAALLTTLASVI